MLEEQLLIEEKIFYLSKKVEILNWLVVKESSNDTIFMELDDIQKDLNGIKRYFSLGEIEDACKANERI
jgi:hypothetical protein